MSLDDETLRRSQNAFGLDDETIFDVKARQILCDKLFELGITDALVIWPDEHNAYLDSGNEEDCQKLATFFNVTYDGEDKGGINARLMDWYEETFEEVKAKGSQQ